MTKNQIKLVIEGPVATGGHIDLKDFLGELTALKSTLSIIDKSVYRNEGNTQFLVSDLSHSSPVSVTLDPIAKNKKNDHTDRVLSAFNNAIESIASGNIPEESDYALLENFRNLSKPIGKTLVGMSLMVEEKVYEISQQFNRNIEQALDKSDSCYGSVEGALEQINLHGNKQHFTIYPDIGAAKVKCIFPEKLHDDAINSIEKRVVVSGEIFYRPKETFPHKIIVEGMIVNPPDSELPTFDDMLGIIPSFAEGIPSEKIIRENRDEWD